MTTATQLWIAAGGVGAALLLAAFPVRRELRDAGRCLARYPGIWLIPALFSTCYAAFEIGLRLLYWFLLPEPTKPQFSLLPGPSDAPPDADQLLRDAPLPALEGAAGPFNAVVATYPLSALAALLFLANWGNHHAVLNKALRKRGGPLGWLADAGLVLCALAALSKPLLFALLPWVGRAPEAAAWLSAATLADWLSFLFEYLLGVFLQLYLILHIYVWVRGLNFSVTGLIDFALRRFSVVAKWAFAVMALSSLLIHLPLVTAQLAPRAFPGGLPAAFDFVERFARPAMSLFLLVFFGVQITLAFHAEKLGRAIRDHFRFAGRNPLPVAALLAFACSGFFVLSFADALAARALGEGSAPGIAWGFLHAGLLAALGAWLLAAWVCLHKKLEAGRAPSDEWIRF